MSELLKLNLDYQANNEELEQPGGRLCLYIEGIPLKNNETSEDVFVSVKKSFEIAEVNIPDMVEDRADRIGRFHKNRASNRNCKGIIVRFTTFRHRTMLHVIFLP